MGTDLPSSTGPEFRRLSANRTETFLLNSTVQPVTLCDMIVSPKVGMLVATCHKDVEDRSCDGSVRGQAAANEHCCSGTAQEKESERECQASCHR
jgi:hypothetical protein